MCAYVPRGRVQRAYKVTQIIRGLGTDMGVSQIYTFPHQQCTDHLLVHVVHLKITLLSQELYHCASRFHLKYCQKEKVKTVPVNMITLYCQHLNIYILLFCF